MREGVIVLSRTTFKRGQGRRLLSVLASAMLLTGTLAVGSVALASTPAGLFELEGNASSASGSGGAAPDDWDRVCHQVLGTDCSTTSDTHGATAVAWTTDTHGAVGNLGACTGTNCTIFTGGGSKDPIDINQWAWKDNVGGLPDKDNLLHGYAARYSIPSSLACPAKNPDGSSNTDGTLKCEMLFFGNDRFDNSGDAQQGFWFFQNKIGLGSNAVGGGNGFTSSGGTEFHRNGDLLLISDFSNGGTVSTINVYTWDTTCLKAVTKPAPGDCGDANLRLQATSTAANCGTPNNVDPATTGFCGIVNANTITMPWTFVDKSNTANNQALNGEFYEGGVNLSFLGLGSECFASVASESRASTSTTAVLKDFVLGSFGECSSKLTTTPKTGAGGTLTADSDSDGLAEASIGTGSVQVKDSAVLTISGVANWSGNLQFYICGPIASGECTSGGVPIGSAKAITNATSQPILSDAATLTEVGRYCWRGVFTHVTTGVPDATDASTGECFEVMPVTPVLATSAGADVVLGNPITDTATLVGTATRPGTNGGINGTYTSINATDGAAAGGKITFVVKAGAACTDSGLTVTPSEVTVSGDRDGNPAADVYGPVQATPTAIGKYTFVATYTGDSPNTLGTAGTCPEATEEVFVGSSSIETTPKSGAGADITDHNNNQVKDLSIGLGTVTASDHAVVTVTGISTWSGSVQFYICGPLAVSPTTTNCATGGDAVGSPVAVSNASNTADSPSTTFSRAARYCWRAEFTSTTTGVPNSSDGRTTECFEVLPVTPVLATSAGADVVLGNPITDTATLTGTATRPGSGGIGSDNSINPTIPGAAAGGKITFVVKAGAACTDSGLTVTPSEVTVSGDRDGNPAADVYGPVQATPTAIGKYTFVATYTGDSPNTLGTAGTCPEATEEVDVTGTSSLSTEQAWTPNDTATLSGDANLNGTLTFVLYNDGTCGKGGGSAVFSPTPTTVTDAASGTKFSTDNKTFTVTASGTYSWLVTYVDDNLGDPAPSCSGVTNLTITN